VARVTATAEAGGPVTALYRALKVVHVSAATSRGGLFAARGAGVLASRRWPTVAPVRYASFIVDSLLLAAAALVIALPTPVFRNAWLAIKLWLVGVYIVLANYAIRRGRTRASRALFLVAALPV
jgi:uncharacterized membrane protein SirB2